MTTCPHCSAPLTRADVEECGHCGVVTPFGVAARQARAAKEEQARAANQQRSEAEAARLRQIANREVAQLGKWSVLSSVVGVALCCAFPVGPALGIYFGSRARKLALERGVPNVGGGMAGTIIGYAGLLLAVAVWVGVGVMAVVESRHKAELRALITPGDALDLKSACALTELEVKGKEAILRGSRFTREGKRVELVSCLKLGSAWAVKQLRDDEDCAAPPPDTKKKKSDGKNKHLE